jgi:hypothetical protein
MNFSLKLDQAAEVLVVLYNLRGERVSEVRGKLEPGVVTLFWDCRAVASGIYFARITVGGAEKAKLKVAVLK